MTEEELARTARTWIALQTTKKGTAEFDELFWASEMLWQLSRKNPQMCWQLVLRILELSKNDWILENLGAGPVEDLLSYNGPEIISAIEAEGRKDASVLEVLRHVWRNDIADDVWARITALIG